MALRIQIPNSTTVIGVISVYRKCGGHKGQFLDWLEATVSQLPLQVDAYILGGDFNIHSARWGSTHNDSGADRLHAIEAGMGSEGRFLNTGSPTRGPWPCQLSFVRDTVIDLTLGFASQGCGVGFENWRTGVQAGSDHFQIWLDVTAPHLNATQKEAGPPMPVGRLLKDPDTVRAFQARVHEELSSTGWLSKGPNHECKPELPASKSQLVH